MVVPMSNEPTKFDVFVLCLFMFVAAIIGGSIVAFAFINSMHGICK